MQRVFQAAFTIVEVTVIVSVISILAGISIVGYGSWLRTQSNNAVKSDMHQALSGLQSYKNFNNSYPPNLAGTGFASSPIVAMKLSTNAPSIGVYDNLSSSQNAQLFLNSCNANMFSTPNNGVCKFQGNGGGAKIHVTGTSGSNAIWNSPIAQSGLSLSCGSEQAACDAALASIISQFTSQGGAFPIVVPSGTVSLPEPTQVPNGPANRYCLEGRAADYPSTVYYATSEMSSYAAGECPNDPTLHYYTN